ncbi:chromophore lyase CpcT/CpeT [Aureispira anguillae]|uniref:Chromophore lyase CpcT/CpeT n=1 Tax=Aureispira anguillae TaxID=2864201 RepID=A0A915YKP5_9BACT|nr:chromophore lyase CpcT/CpeT [Aureispira anguillae]BDS14983.1 chromophore lyase CpcT/CpeT [Aureispira anguillae]
MKVYFSFFLTMVSVILIGMVYSCNKEQYNYLDKTKTGKEIQETENRLEKVFNMYLGLFSNRVQARSEQSPLYRSQELISVPIWPKRGDEYWLYVCWLQENLPDDLLSQEVWHFKKKDRETLEIIMYDLPNKDKYVNDWKKKEPLAGLTSEDLIYNEGCTALVTRDEQNKFTITGTPCRRDLSDIIKFIEIHGVITPDSIILYNKMLDGNKKALFAYKKGLHFERQPKIFPKYLDMDG